MVSRSRLTPDPAIMVGDLQRCICAFCKTEGSFDLQKLLLPSLSPSNWKNAADPTYLAGPMSSLLKELFKVAPNGVVASKKFKQALEKFQTDSHRRVNQSKLNDADFWSLVDNNVRAAASQYRDLKLSASKYATCMRKASLKEKEVMDGVLELLVCKEENSSAVAEQEGKDGNREAKQLEKVDTEKSVFKRILSQQPSDASSPGKRYYKKSKPEPLDEKVPPGSSTDIVAPEAIVNTDPSAEKRLPQLGLACSPENGPTSALALSTTSNPWSGLACVTQGMEEKEVDELKGWMATKVDVPLNMKKKRTGKGSLKKPAASSTSEVSLRKPAASLDVAKEGKTENHKSTFRHRKTSSAYHAAKNHAKKMGKCKEEQLAAGRAASSKMGADIDNGIIKEN